MNKIYYYFLLNSTAYFRKAGRIQPLHLGMNISFFIVAEVLVGVNVLMRKSGMSMSVPIIASLIILLSFYLFQIKVVLPKYHAIRRTNIDLEYSTKTANLKVILLPLFLIPIAILFLVI